MKLHVKCVFKRVCSLTPSPEHSLDVIYHNLCSDFPLVPVTLFTAAISFLIQTAVREHFCSCGHVSLTVFMLEHSSCLLTLFYYWPFLISQFLQTLGHSSRGVRLDLGLSVVPTRSGSDERFGEGCRTCGSACTSWASCQELDGHLLRVRPLLRMGPS